MDVFHTPYQVFSRLLRKDCVKPLPYTTALQGCQGFLSVAWKRSQVMKQHCIRMGYGVQVQLSCLRGMSSFYIQFLQLSRRRISHLASRDGFCLS